MTQSPEPMSREWNYHPDLPLANPSIFQWPPHPGFLGRWLVAHWLTLSERVMMVMLAVFCWAVVYPPFDVAASWSLGWVAHVWAANLALMICVAGALHWYFYMRKGQGAALKFDHRPPSKGNRLWDFSNQVHDNMFWSLTSGVGVLTAYQALVMWAMASGWAPSITPLSDPVWFVVGLMLLPI